MPSDPDPPICKVCRMVPIAGCRNTLKYPSGGAILMHRGEQLVSVDCPNMRVVSLRQRLLGIDPQFLQVTHYASTPLYQTRGKIDRTRDDLFIRHVHWKTFLSHFKWVIGSKGPGFFVRIVTDMTLLNVYLGKASIQNRLPSQRTDDGELLISNSIEDLLSSPDLAVIRLGHVIARNRIAGNVLREALSLRLGMGKATWLVEPPEQTFEPGGMTCCDDPVMQLVESTFHEIQLFAPEVVEPDYVEDDDGVTVRGSTVSVEHESEDDQSEDDEPVADEVEPEEPEAVESMADDDERPRTADEIEFDALTQRKPKTGYQRSKPKKRR